MAATDPRSAARDILAFHAEAGVDAVLGDAPVDRFAESAKSAESADLPPPERGRPTAEAGRERTGQAQHGPSPAQPRGARPHLSAQNKSGESKSGERTGATLPAADAAVADARAAAASAASLDELRAALARFDGCALKFTAKQLVFADGNPEARVMFVGEAPGAEEDREGLPFVGRAGKLLDRMLAAIGLDRSGAYIANIVPWRPPGNRTPTPQEAAICLPFIRRQIELADPDVLVCLGGPASQTLLGVKEGITKARGRWLDYDTGARTIRALATFHPAYLLRTPAAKRLAWRDLLAIRKVLQ